MMFAFEQVEEARPCVCSELLESEKYRKDKVGTPQSFHMKCITVMDCVMEHSVSQCAQIKSHADSG